MKLHRAGILAAIFAVVLAACGNSGGNGGTSSVIKIGVTGPFTGNYAAPGLDILAAAKVMASTLNKSGGIAGHQVEIVQGDDQCDAQVGVQAAESLVSQHVVAFVGGYCSGASIPETDDLRKHGNIPFIGVASSNPKLTEQGYKNVFRVILRDDYAGKIDASFMTQVLQGKNVAIMNDNSTYAVGLAQAGRDAVKASGGNVVYYDAITPGQHDYSSAMTKVASTNPDVFYYTGYYPEAATLAKAYFDQGLNNKFKFMVGSGEYDPAYVSAAGSNAEGSTVTFPVGPDTASGADFNTFKAAYTAAEGKDMGTYAIYEHDAIMMLKLAIEKANGSTKPDDITNALHQVSYNGITGQVKFDDKGDRAQLAMVGYKVSGGKFVPTWKLVGSTWQAYS